MPKGNDKIIHIHKMFFSFATDTFPGLQNIRWSVNVGCKFSICGLCQCACIVAVRKSALQDTETNNIALSSSSHRVGETIFNLKLAPSQISTIYHLSSVVECKQQHCLVPINTNTAGSRGLWWRLWRWRGYRGRLTNKQTSAKSSYIWHPFRGSTESKIIKIHEM